MRPCPRALPLLFAAILIGGCGKAETIGLGDGLDSGIAVVDTGTTDTGPITDLGVPNDDFGTPFDDSGVEPDATELDLGFGPDGEVPEVGPGPDGAVPDANDPDGGTNDATPGPDGGPNTDGGPNADGGPRPDGGPNPDGGATDGGPQQCTSDMDCGIFGVFGHCEPTSGQCVECLEDAHCLGNGVCDVAGGYVCRRPCTAGGNCIGGGVCDPAIGACVECLTDPDCDSGQVCNPTTRSCQECFLSADCALQPGQPICNPAGECVGCNTDADCSGGETCYASQGGFCAAPQGRGLCEPCENDDECGGPDDLCIGYIGNNGLIDRACGTDCSNGQTCPSGYECVSVRQGSGQQCRPRYDMQTPTCTATRNLGQACLFDPGVNDPGCGISGLQDARCFASTTSPGVCTTWCNDNAQCPSGFTCQQIGNQGYCL